ncbi:MAG TPA: hypothetical protein VGF45_21905 [Polyangia bacterium]
MSETKDEVQDVAGTGGAANGDVGVDDRRSFMRRLVSGSLIAGGVGATVLPARSAAAAPVLSRSLLAAAPSAKPMVKLTINRRKPPTLDELVEIVAVATGKLGCTGCGFDGIDLRLVVDELVDPDPPHWVGAFEEQVGF